MMVMSFVLGLPISLLMANAYEMCDGMFSGISNGIGRLVGALVLVLLNMVKFSLKYLA